MSPNAQLQNGLHTDVLIIGAGLSGIGTAAHLVREVPGKSFVVLESRQAIGGTWDLFKYPGIRSDSDMYTFGYSFKPWNEDQAISDGHLIKGYIEETAEEYGILPHIRFQHQVVSANWSTKDHLWVVKVERTDTGEVFEMTAAWVVAATGYYDYAEGHRPTFTDEEKFSGTIVHPQQWPDDLDYSGKRIAVIGSGATAVTLVPSLAESAAHVTMIQRTPTYIASVPKADPMAKVLRRVTPSKLSHPVLRFKNMLSRQMQYSMSRVKPDLVKSKIREGAVKALPNGYDVDTHFNPPYAPWDQRICAVPDGDLFDVISRGRATIETTTIEAFTETGIALANGHHVDADIIVTATGLKLKWLGGMNLVVDGTTVELGDRFAYKGMMVSGVPNFSLVSGYTNNSFTLKADLISRYLTDILKTMDDHGYVSTTPITPIGESPNPFIDLDSGYVHRGIGAMAKEGTRVPWRLHQNYMKDIGVFKSKQILDGNLVFRTAADELNRVDGQGRVAESLSTPKQIELSTGSARYRDEGEGTPVVLVHGVGRSLEDWNEQHELLSNSGFRVVSLDLAGFGESAPLREPYSLPALARWLKEALDEIGITEPAHLVGNSLGGAVVMTIAEQSPERVLSLTLADAAGFGREVALPIRLMSIRPIGEKMMGNPSPKAAKQLESSLFHDQSFVTQERIDLGFRLSARPEGSRVFLDTVAALGSFRGAHPEWRDQLLTGLKGREIPTLVVWGEKDTIFPASQLDAARVALPHAETHLFANTGHMPQIEKSEEFARVMTSFWAKIQPKISAEAS